MLHKEIPRVPASRKLTDHEIFVYVTGQFRPLAALGVRATATSSTTNAAAVAAADPGALYQRPVRQEPGKVRLGFVPEEWFTFFYKKTGVTGPYTFLVTFGTYLISKEIYVMEHEFYNGLSFLVMWIYGVKKFGPTVAKWLDKEIDVSERQNEKYCFANFMWEF